MNKAERERVERVLRLSGPFPWSEYHSGNPITDLDVIKAWRNHGMTTADLVVVDEVVKLVNERPTDPFEGIA